MRSLARFFLVLFPIILIIAFVSTAFLENVQEGWLKRDLVRRSKLVFSGIEDTLTESLERGEIKSAIRVLNRVSRNEQILGVLVCPDQIQNPATFPPKPLHNDDINPAFSCETLLKTVDVDLFPLGDQTIHIGRFELTNSVGTKASVFILNNATFWLSRNYNTRFLFFVVLAILGGVVVLAATFTARWTLSRPLKDLAFFLREAVSAPDSQGRLKRLAKTEFAPLLKDLSFVTRSLQIAQRAGEIQGTWSPQRLKRYVTQHFGSAQMHIIANREPFIHQKSPDGKIIVQRPASGLVTGVEPLLRSCDGVWIAHGSGSADREVVDKNNCVRVPAEDPEYTLRRVWLTTEEEEGYYYGFSNEGLWPLCHIAHQRPRFSASDWESYLTVNRKFADAYRAQNNSHQSSIVLIQDYHFSVLPRMIREVDTEAFILLFWHIPWPNPEGFGICPWRREIVEGMLAADVIGFHTRFYCNNFIDTVDRYVESQIDRELQSVRQQNHECRIRAIPISIAPPSPSDGSVDIRQILGLPPKTVVAVGVDRIDYTKGILERIQGVARFAELRPDLAKNFAFVQIGAPSRTHIPAYKRLNEDLHTLIEQTNESFKKTLGRDLIISRLFYHNPDEIKPFYEQANICLVTPLHDGMNLVAKEFVASRCTQDGVLIISQFAGASRELREALNVNPYGPDDIASKLVQAYEMSTQEQRDRMRAMRKTVQDANVYRWAYHLLFELDDVRQFHNITGIRSLTL